MSIWPGYPEQETEGMTDKQANRHAFYAALEEYKQVEGVGVAFVAASVRLHVASGQEGVTRNMRRLVNQAYRDKS